MISRAVDIKNTKDELRYAEQSLITNAKKITDLRERSSMDISDIDNVESELSELKRDLKDHQQELKDRLKDDKEYRDDIREISHKLAAAKGITPTHVRPCDKERPDSEQTIVSIKSGIFEYIEEGYVEIHGGKVMCLECIEKQE